MSLDENKMKSASLKYVNTLGTSNACGIDVISDDIKYAVPIDPDNRHYALIKNLLDAGEISIQDADN
jgi:hypothetical protein